MAEPEKHIEVSAFEHRDLSEGFIWAVAGIGVTVLLACALMVVWLYPQAATDRILSSPLPNFPEPHLQADPAADMRRFHAQQLEALNGKAHIPIGTAMQQVAAEGIADWPPP